MANDKSTNENLSSEEASAREAGTQPPRGDVTEQRGGEQSDQLSGETQEGAHNLEMRNRNPQGNKTD